MFQRALFLVFSLLLFADASAQQQFFVKKDLKDQWLVIDDQAYKPFNNGSANGLRTIYFTVGANQFPSALLQIWSAKPYSVFINGKITTHATGFTTLPLDSLSSANYSNTLNFSIYQDHIIPADLSTRIVTTKHEAQSEVIARKQTDYFKDFVISAGLIIIIFFVSIITAHPKLAAEYFSVG
jgi:hypothetical protein